MIGADIYWKGQLFPWGVMVDTVYEATPKPTSEKAKHAREGPEEGNNSGGDEKAY